MNINPHCSCTRITLYRRHCALFTRPITTLFRKKKNLKMGPTVLFTHLKIILLQCFQFSVFMMNVQLVRSIFGYKEFCIKVNQEPKKKIRVYVRISKEFSLT